MRNSKYKLIKCPKCGRQYFPSEIFYPNEVFGRQLNVIRDEQGNIIYYEGTDQELKEEYTCDNCNTHFIVELIPTYETKINELTNFSEDYSSEIYKDRITLTEPSLFEE